MALWMARLRRWHSRVAPLVLLPLMTTVITGLMSLHEGEWLGPQLEPVVVVLNALGVLWMLITGGGMMLQSWRNAWKKRSVDGGPAG